MIPPITTSGATLTRWEYLTQPVPIIDIQAMLAAAGQIGWECCGIVPGFEIQGRVVTGPPVPGVIVILKRPLGAGNLSPSNGSQSSSVLTSGG